MRKSYELVKQAFKAMRSAGFVAKPGFMCCRGCAGTSIANDVEAMPEEKRAKVRGCVLTTKQDVERIDTRESLWISFGPIRTSKFGDVGDAAEAVGSKLVAELEKAGVVAEWDGHACNCVRVDLKATDTRIEAAEKVEREALVVGFDLAKAEREVAAAEGRLAGLRFRAAELQSA